MTDKRVNARQNEGKMYPGPAKVKIEYGPRTLGKAARVLAPHRSRAGREREAAHAGARTFDSRLASRPRAEAIIRGRISRLTVASGYPPWHGHPARWIRVRPSDMGKLPMPLAPPSIRRCGASRRAFRFADANA